MGTRAPGGFAINDLRSAAILQEYVFTLDPCAPGGIIRKGAAAPCHAGLLNCGAPPYGFDNPKDNVTIIAGTFIIATVLGLVNSFALFIPVVQREYGMGFVEVCFTAALTYAVIIKTSCLACLLIRWIGHRLTAMFGMLLIFIGVLLDSQVLHFAVFYVAHIVFIGIGGGLAYTAAMCLPGDLFRKMITKAMILVCIGGRIGTILFYWFTLFLLSHISYKWTKLCLAIIVLMLTAATNLLPGYIIDDSCDTGGSSASPNKSQRDLEIKKSVQQAARKDRFKGPKHPNEKSCLCVCVCDISLWSDWSFLLWAMCVFLATMALYVPYMYIIAYADSVGVELSPWYITTLCLASIVGRIIMLLSNDHTFDYNRMVFIGACILSGVLWILLQLTETFGWILVWCAAMGLIEAVLVCVIPRLTLVTIPRRWVEHSWGWILWFHAMGVFIITIFVAIVARELLDFYVAFLVIGISQIICGIIAILLPNEENCDNVNGGGIGVGLGRTGLKSNCDPCADPCGPTSELYKSIRNKYMGRSGAASVGGVYSSYRSTTGTAKAACNCPICDKVGCIPECPGCVPGGLSTGGGGQTGPDPCDPSTNSSVGGGSSQVHLPPTTGPSSNPSPIGGTVPASTIPSQVPPPSTVAPSSDLSTAARNTVPASSIPSQVPSPSTVAPSSNLSTAARNTVPASSIPSQVPSPSTVAPSSNLSTAGRGTVPASSIPSQVPSPSTVGPSSNLSTAARNTVPASAIPSQVPSPSTVGPSSNLSTAARNTVPASAIPSQVPPPLTARRSILSTREGRNVSDQLNLPPRASSSVRFSSGYSKMSRH